MKYILLLLTVGFSACNFTTSKAFVPELKTDNETIQQELNEFLGWEHINYDGIDKTVNGKKSKELVVEVINGKNIPEDNDELNVLAKKILMVFKENLKSPEDFDDFKVSFVTKTENTLGSSSVTRSISYKPEEI